jgi:two-component system, chemotaxis family, protein-glutamate methylesterase/glutaminase
MEGVVHSQLRVLIIDDSPFTRRVIRLLLEDAGDFRVIGEAADGEQGLEMIRTLKPDIITLDQEMPVLNGIDTLKKLRLESDIPVVFVSALPTMLGASGDDLDMMKTERVVKTFSNNPIDLSVFAEELTTKLRRVWADNSQQDCRNNQMIRTSG